MHAIALFLGYFVAGIIVLAFLGIIAFRIYENWTKPWLE